jgi:hypothetical protein
MRELTNAELEDVSGGATAIEYDLIISAVGDGGGKAVADLLKALTGH